VKILHLLILWVEATSSLLRGKTKGISTGSAFTLGQYILSTSR